MTGFFLEVVSLDDLDRVVRVGLLYDQYGPLLTAHQCEAVELYYLQNWSLQEIAEAWSTSRQAVHDLIGRSVRLLEDYETRLGLEAREQKNREALLVCLNRLQEALSAIEPDQKRARESLEAAKAVINGLLGPEDEASGGRTGVY